MPAVHDLQESAGFQELARITLQPVSPPVSHGIQEALALLLHAASIGNGSVPFAATRLTPADLDRIETLPQFFHRSTDRLSLPRYAQYESEVLEFFATRLPAVRLEDTAVADALNAILPADQIHDANGTLLFDNAQQRLAIAGLVDSRIGILTGGPGTGKTTTAAALLAVLRRLHPGLESAQVLVAAPTGKAACRIGESIRNSIPHLQSLSSTETGFLRSITARTLHRALEWSPAAPEDGGPFKRNAGNPLEARVILVDEASMVDLQLMRALIQAMPSNAALFLLGDSDQLESVEVGGVLLQLVARSVPAPAEFRARLASRLGTDSVTEEMLGDQKPGPDIRPLPGLAYRLQQSRRAMHAPWILQLAALVRPSSSAPIESVLDCLQQHPGKLQFVENPSDSKKSRFLQEHWRAWLEAVPVWRTLAEGSEPEQLAALDHLRRFQFLCSTNAQVDRANRLGIHALAPGFRIGPSAVPHGCPILIEKNSHALGLTNGDVGIALGKPGDLLASLGLFQSAGAGPVLFPLASLPTFSPAFGLTIHKSQGSEWDTVAIELPSAGVSGLLTRNLLYTALTRASRSVHLLGDPAVLETLLKPAPGSASAV